MPYELTVNKSDEFFIAVAKEDALEQVHSFLLIGVKTKDEIHLLSRVGKVCEDTANCVSVSKALFASEQAKLKDEAIIGYTNLWRDINYLAYAINYEQYIDYILLLEYLHQKDNEKLVSYKPSKEEDTTVTLVHTNKNFALAGDRKVRSEADEIDKHVHNLSIGNTCRHSVLELLKYVLKSEDTSNISNLFFRNLPLHTKLIANDGPSWLVEGKKQQKCFIHPDSKTPFYILPPPPSSVLKDKSPLEGKILTELYKQMETMLKIAPNDEKTKKKFELLKELYNQKIGNKKENLDTLVSSIRTWRNTHSKELNTLRETYFFDSFFSCFFKRKSATEKMFNRFEEYFLELENTPK